MQIDQLTIDQKLDKSLDQHVKLAKTPVDPAASSACAAGPSVQAPAPAPAPTPVPEPIPPPLPTPGTQSKAGPAITPAKAPARSQGKSPAPQFGQPRGGRPDRESSRGASSSFVKFGPGDVVRNLGMTDVGKRELLR
eukprot:12407648-Karenia_brevis.AAC.1